MTSMLADSLFLLTFTLIVLLLLRKYLLSRMGALFCYQIWALVPLLMAVTLLPINNLFTAEVSVNNLFYQVTVIASEVPAFSDTNWFSMAWMIGAFILLSLMLLSHLLFHLRISPSLSPVSLNDIGDDTVEHELPIFKSKKVRGPMLLGFFKPKLILPANFESIYSPSQQALIIAHEHHHFARGDIFWNLCALIFTIVYWFHPLSWLALRKFKQDQELSCDYAVLVEQTTFDKQQYAYALVNTVETQPMFVTHLSFGYLGAKNMLNERINQINTAKPYKKFTALALFTGLFLTISLVFTTQLMAGDSSTKAKGETEDAIAAFTLKPIVTVEPAYPSIAAEQKIEGWVILEFGVSTSGTVQNILIIESYPKGVFDEEARKAVAKWRYAPPKTQGIVKTIQLDFKLDINEA